MVACPANHSSCVTTRLLHRPDQKTLACQSSPRKAKQRGDEGVVGSPAVESPVEPMSEDSDDEAVPNSSDVEDSGDEEEEGEEGDVEESNSESETEHESDSGSDSDFA